MISNIVKIQLVPSVDEFTSSGQTGFLDVKQGSAFPITRSISDIRDVQSRSGSYTKTLTLVGNKNNNLLLNNYFNLNVEAGTFDINKIQPCIVIQNGVIILDNAYIRLVKVVNQEDNSALRYDEMEYEVQIRDAVSDFYKDTNNKYLSDLTDWDQFDHKYTVANIIDSFNNTVVDGYKYILPHIDSTSYEQKDILPGIYAKIIFDKIHQQNGYSYDWADLADKLTQFDKLIIPYSGDVKKLGEAVIEKRRIKADKFTYPQGNGVFQGVTGAAAIIVSPMVINDNVIDPLSLYDIPNSTYKNDLDVVAPNKIVYDVKVTWALSVINPNGGFAIENGFADMSSGVITLEDLGPRSTIRVEDVYYATPKGSATLTADTFSTFGTYYPLMAGLPVARNEDGFIKFNGRFLVSAGAERQVCTGVNSVSIAVTDLNSLSDLKVFTGVDVVTTGTNLLFHKLGDGATKANVQYRLRVSDVSIEIAPSADSGLLPGVEIDLGRFLPLKMKQSDFLKSIFQKYNLYSTIDPSNDRKIIYKTRDKFYADGKIIDLTEKLCKELPQDTIFLPEISAKKTVLSYKDDSNDVVLEAYLDETKETYGQVEVTFDNENVKGLERLEEMFSPTVSGKTNFDAIMPYLPPQFKYNARILIDGGELACGAYTIGGITVNTYPYVGMLDKPFDPTFSIEYGLPDYYDYNPGALTGNNLYATKWRRTLSQKNSGKMFKASYWIDEVLFEKIDLDDIIKVKENFFYINKIIDYDGNSYQPTILELLSVEDDLKLASGFVGGTGELPAGITGKAPIKPDTQLNGNKYATSLNAEERWATSSVSPDNTVITQSKGIGNQLPASFRGIVADDNRFVTRNGFYIAGANLTSTGVEVGTDVQLTSTGLNIGNTNIGSSGLTKTSTYIDPDYVNQDYFVEEITGLVVEDGKVQVLGDVILDDIPAPTTSLSTGTLGTIRFDDSYIYIKTSVGWKRSSLTTF